MSTYAAGGREYVIGLVRDPMPTNRARAHLYDGTFADPGLPLCRHGWNRDGGESYSIWRGQEGNRGICATCRRRAALGLSGINSSLSTAELMEKDDD